LKSRFTPAGLPMPIIDRRQILGGGAACCACACAALLFGVFTQYSANIAKTFDTGKGYFILCESQQGKTNS
jgi:hypothetical protein